MEWRSPMCALGVVGALLTPASALAGSVGAAGGRLVVEAGGRAASPGRVSEVLGDPIELEIRRGNRIVEAELRDDGTFVFEAPAGTYRLEYILAGDRVEFVAPMQLKVRAGATTCVGTLTLKLARLEELGRNAHNQLSVTDDCSELHPRLDSRGEAAVELARPGPLYETRAKPSVRTLSMGLRAQLALGRHSAIRAHYWLPLEHLEIRSRLVFLGGAGMVSRDTRGYDVTAAAGLNFFGFEFLGATGYRWYSGEDVAAGLILGGLARFANAMGAIGVRAEAIPDPAAFLTVDLAPFGLLGALL